MTLRPGQAVYIGYCPDKDCATPTARQVRLSIGTVVSGPFPPGKRGKFRFLEMFYVVSVEGAKFNIASSMLTPIGDTDEPETRKREAEA